MTAKMIGCIEQTAFEKGWVSEKDAVGLIQNYLKVNTVTNSRWLGKGFIEMISKLIWMELLSGTSFHDERGRFEVLSKAPFQSRNRRTTLSSRITSVVAERVSCAECIINSTV